MNDDLQSFVDIHNGTMTEELWDIFLAQYDLKKGTEPDLAEIVDFLQE